MDQDRTEWGAPVNTGWVDIQKRTFTKWCNSHLSEKIMKINDLERDLEDGLVICGLLEQISGKSVGLVNKKPRIRPQKLENTGQALKFLKDEGIKLVSIGPEDIVDGKLKLILGLIWTIILRYQISKISASGNSPKNDLLQWVRKQIPEYNINNFKDDWQDARALCALAESLKPGIIDLSQMSRKSPLENARTGTEASERELGIPPILNPEDLVSPDVDELSVMTYISYFRDYELERNKRESEDLLNRTPDPMKCIAFGPGLERAEVGYETEFTIQARNAAGKNITVGGENFDVQVKAPLNSPPVKSQVQDNGDGTYHATYTPHGQGRHIISVAVRGKAILNSPWTVNAEKLTVDPSRTDAYGPGLEGGIAGVITHFTILAKNKKGDPVGQGGDRFDIAIKGPYDTEVKTETLDNRDGSYTVNYRPIDVGTHTISIAYENKSVARSPYNVPIEQNPEAPDCLQCNAFGPGLEMAIAQEPANFTIQARNMRGDKIKVGGHPFDAEVVGPNDIAVDVKVIDNRDGTYSASYIAPEPGMYRVDVILRAETPLYYEHVAKSPYNVEAESGIDASLSLVYGPGVEDGVLNTKPTEFYIKARDREGKDVGKSGVPFEVKIMDPNGKQLDSPLNDNGDGTYTVQYEPTLAGRHRVDVRLKGKPVGNTPLTVNVKEGASHEHTIIEGFTFTIRTKDKKGKDKKEGGESGNFLVSIVKNGHEDIKTVNFADVGDGTYVVSYSLPGPGEYLINVKLNGEHIRGSPFKKNF